MWTGNVLGLATLPHLLLPGLPPLPSDGLPSSLLLHPLNPGSRPVSPYYASKLQPTQKLPTIATSALSDYQDGDFLYVSTQPLDKAANGGWGDDRIFSWWKWLFWYWSVNREPNIVCLHELKMLPDPLTPNGHWDWMKSISLFNKKRNLLQNCCRISNLVDW